MQNPLTSDILSILKRYPGGVAEHRMLKILEGHPAFADLVAGGNLALFQQHFMLMNALYGLQEKLLNEERLALEISPLRIRILPANNNAGNQLDFVEVSALRDYYLDWRNFSETGEAEVAELLANFWRRYEGWEGRPEALDVLGLPADASASAVSRRYRELAARHHPDKGGDPAVFIEIRKAYERLKNA